MIWQLAHEQLRANRTYTRWVTVLLALTVTATTYIVTMGAIQGAIWDENRERLGSGSEHLAHVPITVEGELGSESLSLFHLNAALVSAENATVIATVDGHLLAKEPKNRWADEDDILWISAHAGDVNWDAIVAEGSAPMRHDDIVLAADSAESLDVSIGDTVTLFTSEWVEDDSFLTREHEFSITGLAESAHLSGFDRINSVDAYLSWAHALSPQSALAYPRYDWHGTPTGTRELTARVYYNGHIPELEPHRAVYYESWRGSTTDIALPQSTGVWGAGAIALALATVVMAFAVGRSQAAARTKWVATARTLGARKRHVVASTITETAIVAGAAYVAGTALGLGLAQGWLTLARATTEYPAGPAFVPASPWIYLIGGGVAVFTAVVIAAVPAFWSTRVDPSAALKPVSDVTESELSRRVPAWWLWLPIAGGLALSLAAIDGFGDLSGIPAFVGRLIMIIGVGALTIEGTRRLVARAGRALSRRTSPAALSAGDALSSRPRQATAPALIIASGFVLVTAASEYSVKDNVGSALATPPELRATVGDAFGWWADNWLTTTTMLVIVIVFAAVQLVIAAIFASQRAATSTEFAAERALGLSVNQQRMAVWLRLLVPQAIGAVVGIVVATTGVLVAAGLDRLETGGPRLTALAWGVAGGTLFSAALAILALSASAGIAALVAQQVASGSPVEALQEAPA